MSSSLSLVERIHRIHASLAAADIPHAFGGAIALGWCTPQARATNDIDINIFLALDHAESVLAGLPNGVEITEDARQQLMRDGQARFWWDSTPVDVFLNTTEFHRRAATRVRRWDFMGVEIPCLSCDDLAVFKAFYNRPKDWIDIGEMVKIESFDVAEVQQTLANLLGSGDERISKLTDAQSEAERMLRLAASWAEDS